MNPINKSAVDKVISEIKSELSDFKISDKNLEKFGKVDNMDEEYLSYVNGVGGHYVKFLALLVKKLQFHNVVELGNREGLSTLSIYDQLPQDSTFTTIDIVEDVRYCPDSMHMDSRVKFILGDVCDIDVFSKLPDKIDLLFSDTIHYDFQVRDEFAIYQHLLADTALVAVDDIFINDKHLFWDDLPYDKWDLSELCHSNGWGLFLYKREKSVSYDKRLYDSAHAAAKIWQRRSNEKSSELLTIKNKTVTQILKRITKKIPGVYKLFCRINNKFNLIKMDTRI